VYYSVESVYIVNFLPPPSQPIGANKHSTSMSNPGNTGGTSATSQTKAKGKGYGLENLESARKFLDELNFLDTTDTPTDTNLAYILRQVAAQVGKIPQAKVHAKALIATALIIEENAYLSSGAIILQRVEEQIQKLTTVPVTEKLTKISNRAVEETKRLEDKGADVVKRIEDAATHLVKDVTDHLARTPPPTLTNGPPNSYAQAAGRLPRTMHPHVAQRPAILDRRHIAERQILIDHTQDASHPVPKTLTPGEWVAKGNLAIEETFKAERLAASQAGASWDQPKVIASSMLRNGGILLELNSKEAALQVRNKQQAFTDNLGIGWTVKAKTWSIKIKFVPITTDLARLGLFQRICSDSDIPVGSISSLRWLRAPQNRNPRQTAAHVIARFNSPEAANKILKDGVIVNGERLLTDKLETEPMRCANCNLYDHLAAECKNCTACANCTRPHKTGECDVRGDPSKFRCVNCKGIGHAAWSQSCPEYERRLGILRSTRIHYRFFVTEEEWTWEKRWDPRGVPTYHRHSPGPRPTQARPPQRQPSRPPSTLPGPPRQSTQPPQHYSQPPRTRDTDLGAYGFEFRRGPGHRWSDEEYDFDNPPYFP
jgi:hypothetical protein